MRYKNLYRFKQILLKFFISIDKNLQSLLFYLSILNKIYNTCLLAIYLL